MLEIDSNGVVKASGDLDMFSRRSREAERSAGGLEQGMGGVNTSAIKTAASITALVYSFTKLTGAVISSTKAMIKDFSDFEQMETAMGSLLGSAQKGKQLFEELRTFSNETTFGVDTLANASSQLLALGVQVDDLKDKLRAMGDVAGGSTEKFNRLVEIYTKIQATGTATMRELDQLSAISGVSWVQVMKDMGVQGKITAEDVSKAFEKLTEEGGRFHGRMEAIIDTIEGKEGFIRDTFKEISVLFAENTGIASAYKKILDSVYESMFSVLGALKDMKDNPLMQALLTGGIVMAITAVGTAFAVAIIPRLKVIIGHLVTIAGLQSMVAPWTLAIAGITAAVAGAAAGVMQWKNAQDELKKSVDEANKSLGYQTHYADTKQSTLYDAYSALIGETKNKRSGLAEELEKANAALEKAIKQKEIFEKHGNKTTKYYDDAKRAVESLNAELAETDRIIADLEMRRSQYPASGGNAALSALQEIQKMYLGTDTGKNQQKVNKLKDILDRVEELRNTASDNGILFGDIKSVATWLDIIEADTKKRIEELTKKAKDGGKKVTESLFEKLYKQTDMAKLEELQRQRLEMLEILKGTDDETLIVKVNEVVKMLDNAIAGFNPESPQQPIDELFARLYGQTDQARLEELFRQRDYISGVLGRAQVAGDNQLEEQAGVILSMLTESIKGLEEAMKMQKKALDHEAPKYNDVLEQVYKQTERARLEMLQEQRSAIMAELQNAKLSGDEEIQAKAVEALKLLDGDIKDLTKVFNKTATTLADKLKDGGFAAYASNIPRIFDELKTGREGLTIAGIKGGSVLGQVVGGIGLSALSKSQDAQDFVQGSIGGPVVGIINMIVGAFMRVAETCDGFSEAMNPVTELMKGLKPVIQIVIDLLKKANDMLIGALEPANEAIEEVAEAIKPIFEALIQFSNIINIVTKGMGLLAKLGNTVLVPVIKGIASVFNLLFGWVDDFLETHSTEEEEDEKEILKQLNAEYKQLMQTMRENEQYYLDRKRELEAETYTKGVLGVNDMIITPQGRFSTHPDDTIIAMKHPESLGGGLSVVVNDYGGNNVDVQQNSLGELIINISRKVASDFASGKNGWDGAMVAQQLRIAGRRVNA